METTTINERKLTEAVQAEEKNTNLNNDCKKTSKNSDFSYKHKPVNTFKTRTCTYFFNYGYCKFGSSCKYKHYKKRNENDKYVSRENHTMMSKSMHKSKHVGNKDILKNLNTQACSNQIGKYFEAEDNYDSLHSVDVCNNEMSALNLHLQSQKISKKVYSASNRSSKKRATPLCYYFKKGLCYKGDSCKYYHQNKDNSSTSTAFPIIFTESKDDNLLLPNKEKISTLVNEVSTGNRAITIFNKTLNVYHSSSLTVETISQLRSTEINQLKKRFPHFEVITENQNFSILFQPSDPDWVFDVKMLKLEVDFSEKYPTEKCKIAVIQNAENIPQLLIQYLNKAICEWIDRKFEENSISDKTELVFRPFLRWFDKNLEELFITGLRKVKQDLKAKEDGIEFVPVENLFSSPKNDIAAESVETENDIINFSQLQEETSTSDHKNSLPLTNQSNKSFHFTGSNGMKIIFSGLELTEGAAALMCTKISVTLQCCRCKTSFNMKSVPKKNNGHVCSKCNKNVGFTFDASTVHQFSSVLGTLHLLDCVAVDINLVECHFLIDCLSCSKQVAVDGIHYGQKHKMWCTFCNEKMLISIGCVKFQALKLTSVSDAKYLPAKKIEKKAKDPVIKEGEPLPNFGACKHYKKSFRWLRFPCCGRLYPCDECHNEKEIDHEMKYASRMICGFCAKEQPYSREKPCLLCSQNLTKKSGSHWEGGKGCRNKIQMSREDKQKYSGVSKTISKKAQNAKPKKKH